MCLYFFYVAKFLFDPVSVADGRDREEEGVGGGLGGWGWGRGEVVGNGDVMTTFIALIISLLAARFSRRVAALPRRTCR